MWAQRMSACTYKNVYIMCERIGVILLKIHNIGCTLTLYVKYVKCIARRARQFWKYHTAAADAACELCSAIIVYLNAIDIAAYLERV